MRAVVCRAYGPPANMTVEDVDPPNLGAGQVRIRVGAAGVGFATYLVVSGKHQNRPDLPFVPGTEIAGTVAECATDVAGLAPGDRVFAGVRHGGFAEQAVADAAYVFKIPEQMSFATATQFPTIYATAYAGLVWRARTEPGEWVLVHGAAGASGLAAVEIARALGARVIATASSAGKLETAAAHGADHVINYREESFRDRVLELTGGRGADVIFDPVGGAVFDQSLRCIAPEGRILPVGFAGGDIPKAPANILLVKNVTVIGLFWGYYVNWAKLPATEKQGARVAPMMADLIDWYTSGRLRPQTDGEFDLDQFTAAFDRLTDRQAVGKVVLTIGQAKS